MATDSENPVLSRKTITLDSNKVVKDVAPQGGLRIIRPAPKAPPERVATVRISDNDVDLSSTVRPPAHPYRDGATVLVVNASLDMARELTVELTTTIPGCNILFAPTLSTALWILKRRCIDIILSSAILPDGNLSRLHEFLELMTPPPELVIMSELGTSRSVLNSHINSHINSHPGYRFVELRRLSSPTPIEVREVPEARIIGTLGADLRNDLNNPLQEIVAMAFVAQASQGLSPVAEQALGAIGRAAENMATVVNGLEEKIRDVVGKSSERLAG